jgi:hypothetical protein
MFNLSRIIFLCVIKMITTMHITLNIQSILQFAFIIVMVAPLPVLLLASPLSYINEKITNKKYYFIVKRHFENPAAVSAEQLQDIFPDKKLDELHQIAYTLQANKSYRSYKNN